MTAIGAGIVLMVLRDIFHTLWHPAGEGSLSRLVMRGVLRVSRRVTTVSDLAGPLGMIGVVAAWGLIVVVGWALIYWPHLPEDFVFSSGLRAGSRSDLLDAFYLSGATVTTLGFGDVVPAAGWLRLVTPLQALVGLGLVTAAVSWVLQIYPALARRRVLAVRLELLRRADTVASLPKLEPAFAGQLLESLALEVVQVRVDLTQYAVTYYFREEDPSAALAATLGYAADLAEVGRRSDQLETRLAGTVLTGALEDLAQLLARQFLRPGVGPDEILDAYAADHGYPRS